MAVSIKDIKLEQPPRRFRFVQNKSYGITTRYLTPKEVFRFLERLDALISARGKANPEAAHVRKFREIIEHAHPTAKDD